MSEFNEPPDHVLAQTAKRIVVNCFRNTGLEDLHAGSGPVTKSGDYSDVRVIDAEGTEWGWHECSHIDQAQMKALMQDAVGRVYTYLKCGDDPEVHQVMRKHDASIENWDRPEICSRLLGRDLAARLRAKE